MTTIEIIAHSTKEAEAIARELHPKATISAYPATDDRGEAYYDTLVWADEADAEGDDGAHAIARYHVGRAVTA